MGKPNQEKRDYYRYDGGEKQVYRYQPAVALPTTLLVRHIALETSVDTIRSEFERFGPIRDIYLPKEFSTGMPKGYGFIKFQNGEDAHMAKEYLNHRVINGQEISIEYSNDANRKKPWQMELMNSRTRERDGSKDGELSRREASVPQSVAGYKWLPPPLGHSASQSRQKRTRK